MHFSNTKTNALGGGPSLGHQEDRGFDFGNGSPEHDDHLGQNNQFFEQRKSIADDNRFVQEQDHFEKLQNEYDRQLMPSELRDKQRYGGNYLNVKEGPNKPLYKPFYVFVSGHIESGQINESDGICCKYDFMAGTDWGIVEVSY